MAIAVPACDFDQDLGDDGGSPSGPAGGDGASGGNGGGGSSGPSGPGGGAEGGVGGSETCNPRSTADCYTGPASTEGVGTCAGGTKTCNEDGTGWGSCTGEVLPSFEVCNTAEDEDCDAATPACPSGGVWAKVFGDVDVGMASDVAVDEDGNVVIAGHFAGTTDFGDGPLTSAGAADAFVAKFDPAGQLLWSQRYGDAADQAALGVAVDGASNVVVTGQFRGSIDFGGGALTSAGEEDVFVAKLDSSGKHVWSKRFGDAAVQTPTSIAANAAGTVVVAGEFDGAIDFGLGPLTGSGGPLGSDGFVVSLDAAGAANWSRGFGNADANNANLLLTDTAGDVAIDASGAVWLVGWFHGTIDLGSGPITSQSAAQDALLVKFDPSGDPEWHHTWFVPGMFGQVGVYPDVVTSDAGGNAIVGGHFVGTFDAGAGPMTSGVADDFFVVKLDPAGQASWSTSYPTGGAADSFTDAATTPSGQIVLTGSFEGDLDFGGGTISGGLWDNLFIVQLDPAGAHQWSAEYVPPGPQPFSAIQVPFGIAVDGGGYIAVAGALAGSIDFGTGVLSSNGSDAFVARISAP
jgi:hypothetical protein